MPVIALRRSDYAAPAGIAKLANHRWMVTWVVFAVACSAAILIWPEWANIPYYLIWISLTLLYGFRTWSVRTTIVVMVATMVITTVTLALALIDSGGHWQSLARVPLMAIMFVTMAWHARRRVETLAVSEGNAKALHAALERQERFIHDASHELKTPVTIARGHLELARGPGRPEVDIALDELRRIDGILGQLLLLATAGQPDFLRPEPVELETFLEDLFIRWSEVAPRSWRLGSVVPGAVMADPERLRTALDALLENAVKYSEPGSGIELRARWAGRDEFVIEVEDEGIGIPREAMARIFSRFGRADAARNRAVGGVGLGLAIVEAIAVHHGGRCTVRSGARGSIFALYLPAVRLPAGSYRDFAVPALPAGSAFTAPMMSPPRPAFDGPMQAPSPSTEVPGKTGQRLP